MCFFNGDGVKWYGSKRVLLQRAGTIGFNELIATANGSGELFDLSVRQPWGNSCGKKLTQIRELNQVGYGFVVRDTLFG